MNYKYKRLSSPDIRLFNELLTVFAEAFEDEQTYNDKRPSDTYLKTLLEKPDFIVLTALNDKAVVGGLVAYVLEKFEQERKEIYIYDLAVSKSHQRKGIATNLIKNLKGIAKDLGAYVIFVQADKEDTPAIRLYESFGKKEDVNQFDINID